MIATRLGLVVAWACAGLLAIALIFDLRGAGDAPDRRVAPGIDLAAVKSLEWSGLAIPIKIERTSARSWKWIEPAGDAERQTIEDLIATLRGARWHRKTAASEVGPFDTRLAIDLGTRHVTIAFGKASGEQQWIRVDDAAEAVLVDSWVVHALVPDPVTLRIRRPFADVASARSIEVGSFVLAGTPRRLTKLAGMPIELLVNASLVDDLERALADITTLAIPRGKVPVDHNIRGTRIALSDKLIAVEAGKCPAPNTDLRAIVGPSIGPACVGEEQYQKLLATSAVFDLRDDARPQMLATLVEPRPAPIDPAEVKLADGSSLSLAKRPTITEKGSAERDADPARVAELLAVLHTPGEPVAVPATPPVATIEVRPPRTDQPPIVIALHGNGVVARKGEPIALRIGAGSYDVLARAGRTYVDPALWAEEPTTIASIKIGDITYTRGVVIGEWTRDKPGAFDQAAVEKLAGLFAAPRSLGTRSAVTGATRSIELAIKPPVGDPRTRTMTLTTGGKLCAGAVDSATHDLDPQLCAVVEGLAN